MSFVHCLEHKTEVASLQEFQATGVTVWRSGETAWYGQSAEEEVVAEGSEIKNPPGYGRENNIGEWLKKNPKQHSTSY